MCGIAGIIDPNALLGDPRAILRGMANALSHRGPDEEQLWIDQSLGTGLAFRRLSIVDLTPAASQPMQSASRRYVIVFNGEIYNFRSLESELKSMGALSHRRSTGDTEVLLAAIEHWGLDIALTRLVGMFAFALVDRESRTVSLVRDRFGVKPLVYSEQPHGVVAFASELAALRTIPSFDDSLDPSAVTAFIRFGCIPAPLSIHRHAKKLEPGSMAVIQLDGGALSSRRWWSPVDAIIAADGNPTRAPFTESVGRLEQAVELAVRDRLASDVPLGAWLSSGIDSTLIVAMAKEHRPLPLRTFSAAIDDVEYDESASAARIAAHLGTAHTTLSIATHEIAAVSDHLCATFDEPFGDSSAIPVAALSKATRSHVTVVLSGDGGDELFAGYDRQRHFARFDRLCGWMPQWMRRSIGSLIGFAAHPAINRNGGQVLAWIPGARRSELLSDRLRLLADLLQLRDLGRAPSLLSETCRDPARFLLNPSPWQSPNDDLMRRAGRMNPLRSSMLFDVLHGLPSDLLVKNDWCSMQVGLEVRSPLLDHRLYELSCALTPTILLQGGRSKAPLRAMVEARVPPSMISNTKRGFGVPLARWMRHDLRDWMESTLSRESLAASGLFHERSVQSLWQDHLAHRTDAHATLWNIAVLTRWINQSKRRA